MAREMTSGFDAALDDKVIRLAFFADFAFDSGTVRLWTGGGVKAWNGENWQGTGTMAGVSAVDETTEIGAAGLTFTLSGFDADFIALAFGEQYRGRKCRLWMARMDASWDVLDALQLFGGRMDVMKTDDSGDTGSLSISAENRLIDLRRARTLRYTPADQKRLYPDDTGLRYVAQLAEAPINWGVPASAIRAAAPTYAGGSNAASGYANPSRE